AAFDELAHGRLLPEPHDVSRVGHGQLDPRPRVERRTREAPLLRTVIGEHTSWLSDRCP
ncbi:MAG: hypothetical protein JWR88_753, partial [Pseudonocardia sp.]|nr:hypothetical protein [Pseudonocardia sp.]